MINLFFLLAALLSWNSGHFWLVFILFTAVARYRMNRLKSLFWIAPVCYLIFTIPAYFKVYLNIDCLFMSQMIICGISIFYNTYKKLWAKDYLFFYFEPFLMYTYYCYNFGSYFGTNLHKWLAVYAALAAVKALWEILGLKIEIEGYRLAFGITPHAEFQKFLDDTRFKLNMKLARLSGKYLTLKEVKRELKNGNNGGNNHKNGNGKKWRKQQNIMNNVL
ncbi:hypothetical protein ACFL7D_08220 [candidate division KSB1 bacterium]